MDFEALEKDAKASAEVTNMLCYEGALAAIEQEAKKHTAGQYQDDISCDYGAGILCIRAGLNLMWASANRRNKLDMRTPMGAFVVYAFIEGALSVSKVWLAKLTGLEKPQK